MCGMSSGIVWQLFFSISEPFWPTFAHFTSSGRYSLYRGAGPKRLSKNSEIWAKITKSEKNRTYHQNVRNFVRNRVATFFFRFWTRSDPLLAILLVVGGTASIGEPDQKDLAKIWNLTKNHQKRKKSNLSSKCAEFRQESPGNFFFSILDPFWPTFGHFTSSVQ